MARKEKYESGIPSAATSETSGVESIYICNYPTGAKIHERAQEHIQTGKPSYIITTSHYRVPAVIQSTSQVQQGRPLEESAQAEALTDGTKSANRGIQHRESIHGRRKRHKPNICKNSEGNVHLIGKSKANRLFLPRNSTFIKNGAVELFL
jgi:hypothetical protein